MAKISETTKFTASICEKYCLHTKSCHNEYVYANFYFASMYNCNVCMYFDNKKI